MGRSILAEENVESIVNYLVTQKSWKIGLVIGQHTVQKDIVCHMCCTPEETGSDKAEEKIVKKTNQKSNRPKGIEDVDETWVAQHAKQVIRMLPGGLDILGIFVVYPADTLQSNQLSKLKQVLVAVFRVLANQVILEESNFNDKMVLHIFPASRKVTAKTFDVSDPQSFAKPADFKYAQGGSTWHRLDCQITLEVPLPVNAKESRYPILKQIQNGLKPFCKGLNDALLTIDGRLRKPEDLLEDAKDGRRTKGRETRDRREQFINHSVDIYMDMCSHSEKISTAPSIEDCSIMVCIKGTLQSRSYLHGKASAAEAAQAVKQDIVRSLMARCEIHFEDLLMIDEEQLDPCVVHEPPRRVFARLPNSELTVSDYLFPGEKAADSLEAYQELLSLTLTDDDIEFGCEKLPDPCDLEMTPVEKTFHPSTEVLNETFDKKPAQNYLVIGLSVAIAILAFSLAYLIFRD